jgi:hypothetical protein
MQHLSCEALWSQVIFQKCWWRNPVFFLIHWEITLWASKILFHLFSFASNKFSCFQVKDFLKQDDWLAKSVYCRKQAQNKTLVDGVKEPCQSRSIAKRSVLKSVDCKTIGNAVGRLKNDRFFTRSKTFDSKTIGNAVGRLKNDRFFTVSKTFDWKTIGFSLVRFRVDSFWRQRLFDGFLTIEQTHHAWHHDCVWQSTRSYDSKTIEFYSRRLSIDWKKRLRVIFE